MTAVKAKPRIVFIIDNDYYTAKVAYENLIIPTHNGNRVYEYCVKSDEEKRRHKALSLISEKHIKLNSFGQR